MTTDHTPQLRARLSLTGSLFALLTCVCLAFLVLAGSALGATTRPYQSSFGSFVPNLNFTFEPSSPSDVAVDQSNGDVYVLDSVDDTVVRFDSSGAPKNFTAGPDAGTNTLTGFTLGVLAIAIDNSGGPLDGTIYAIDTFKLEATSKVRAFARSGAGLGAIEGTATEPPFGKETNHFEELRGLAVDQSNGDLYISSRSLAGGPPRIWRFAPSSPAGAVDDEDYKVSGLTSSISTRLAAEAGSVYAVDAGSTDLRKYSVADFSANFKVEPPATVLHSGVTAVSVDHETGEIYANEGNRIAVLDAAGALLYRFGYGAYFGVESRAIAVKSAVSGSATKAYVADTQMGGQVDVFGALTLAPALTHPELAAFGNDGSAATQFGNQGPNQLGFDQAARRLFVHDRGVAGIYGFDASAPPAFPALAGFAPLASTGANISSTSGVAVDNTALPSAGRLYFASDQTDLLYGWSPAGAPLGGAFPIDPATNPGVPTGSPKGLCGVAVDSAGNVWVTNTETKRVLRYSSAGAFLGAINTSAQGTPCRIALDSNDDLYANIEGSGVWRYTAASAYATATKVAPEGIGQPDVVALAVDPSTHHLFVAYRFSGGSKPVSWVDEYDQAGNFIDEFAIAKGTSFFSGLTIDATNHYAYLSDEGQHKVRVFGPGAIYPEAATRPPSPLANTSATLNGLLSTQGVALSDCHFEYVSEAAFKASGFSDLSSGGALPCTPAAGSIPLDLEQHSVSAVASGLAKDVTYRFRLVATNSNGTVASDPALLTTTAPPRVETTGTPLRSARTAQLLGRVYPVRAATTYHFEYGTEGPCDANPCTATTTKAAGSGNEFVRVAETIEGLQPNTTYHYRLLADNANPEGPAAGEDMTVTTRPSDVPLSHGHYPGPPASDRAYEQVTMPDTGGNPAFGPIGISGEGDRAAYEILGGTPASESGGSFSNFYFSQRDPVLHPQRAWQTSLITPPRAQLLGPAWTQIAAAGDLSSLVLANASAAGDATAQNAIWRVGPEITPQRLFDTAPGQTSQFAGIEVAPDSSRAPGLFTGGTLDPAFPAAAANQNLYDVSSGTPQLLSLLPGEALSPCGVNQSQIASTPIFVDDEHALFSAGCSPHQLYLREIDAAQTKLLSGPPLSGPSCAAALIKVTDDGAFFWTETRLDPADVAAAGCGSGGGDVYRYRIEDESLECVTCVAAEPANVAGSPTRPAASIAVSDDGSRLYFSSTSRLLPGAPPQGQAGVYRVAVKSGDLAYVGAPGAPLDTVSNAPAVRAASVSADGSLLLFGSSAAAMDTLGATTNAGTRELYLYDDDRRSVVCVSCPPDGSLPASSEVFNAVLATEGGNVAFTTATSLLGVDQNTPGPSQDPRSGTDVYEWRDGRLMLITDGLTAWQFPPGVSGFSPSGRDLYFTAAARLTPDALDAYNRIYDARLGGGIDFPEVPKPCPLEVCQGTPKGAPEEQAPGSGSFAGPGNKPAARGCPKGKARRQGRCVKKAKAGKRRQHRNASHDRRAHR